MLILYADDNPADHELARLAIEEAGLDCEIRCLKDGRELLAYLRSEADYADAPPPDLLLLDLNMPGKNGLEVLAEIKGDPDLWEIPTIVLTSSKTEADMYSAYDAGATAYMKKPGTFKHFVQVMKKFGDWWVDTVRLPSQSKQSYLSKRVYV